MYFVLLSNFWVHHKHKDARDENAVVWTHVESRNLSYVRKKFDKIEVRGKRKGDRPKER